MNDEEKNKEISDLLRNLPRVKAQEDFMQRLEMKIAEYESGKNASANRSADRESFLNRIFGKMKNPWLVPAAGIAVAAVFVFYISNFNKNEISNENSPVKTEEEKNIDRINPGKNEMPPPDIKEKNQISVPGTVNESEDIKDKNHGKSPQTNESQYNIKPDRTEAPQEIRQQQEVFDGAVMESSDEDANGGNMKAAPQEKTGLYKNENANKDKIIIENPEKTAGPETSVSSELSSGDSAKKTESDSLLKLNRISKKNLDSLKKKIDK